MSEEKNMDYAYSTGNDEWETPWDFFNQLHQRYLFRLDPCATHKNHKCDFYFTKSSDGLQQDWSKYGSVFMNPPYGRPIAKWIKKAYEESLKGCLVVCLIPARTDTKWWHAYCTKGDITYLEGRLKFRGWSKKHQKIIDDVPAGFPSAIVKFEGRTITRKPHMCPARYPRPIIRRPRPQHA